MNPEYTQQPKHPMGPAYTQQLSHAVTFEAFPWVDVSCTTEDASTFESWEAEMILSNTKRSHSLHETTLYSHNHQHRHYHIGTNTGTSLNTLDVKNLSAKEQICGAWGQMKI